MTGKKTGKELLVDELRERGLTEQQIKSKAVAVVLDVIANDGTDRYLNAKEVDDEIARKNIDLRNTASEIKHRKWMVEREIEALKERRDNLEKNIKAMRAEFDEYVAEFGKSLEAMETPEQRDRLRTAQIFINSVKVRTDGNNTAYIHGLALLLSGVELKEGLENGLRSMTNKDFEPDRRVLGDLPSDLPLI